MYIRTYCLDPFWWGEDQYNQKGSFVQSSLPDRCFYRSELLLISLEILYSVEYANIQKVFFTLVFSEQLSRLKDMLNIGIISVVSVHILLNFCSFFVKFAKNF